MSAPLTGPLTEDELTAEVVARLDTSRGAASARFRARGRADRGGLARRDPVPHRGGADVRRQAAGVHPVVGHSGCPRWSTSSPTAPTSTRPSGPSSDPSTSLVHPGANSATASRSPTMQVLLRWSRGRCGRPTGRPCAVPCSTSGKPRRTGSTPCRRTPARRQPARPVPGSRRRSLQVLDGPPGQLRDPRRRPSLGRLLRACERHPWYLESDTVFGVKESLIEDFVPQADGSYLVEHDFVLRPNR